MENGFMRPHGTYTHSKQTLAPPASFCHPAPATTLPHPLPPASPAAHACVQVRALLSAAAPGGGAPRPAKSTAPAGGLSEFKRVAGLLKIAVPCLDLPQAQALAPAGVTPIHLSRDSRPSSGSGSGWDRD